ncbi:MAG: Imidazole glycerol phosphate synthase subunit HisH [Phycisphaerae bacterium]|nr:Imidazole glycerol phosphate synthase subunit HisH [Phycisphaerae bacterium]
MRDAVMVVRTGTANLASVLAGLRRAGARAEVTQRAADVAAAQHVVLPGVGAFGAAMEQLHAADLVDALRQRVRDARPTLAICLGMQLLAAGSDESPGVSGLALFDARARRLPDTVRVPQIGWNRVLPEPVFDAFHADYAYFANSYAIAEPPTGWHAASADYGSRFVAALQRGGVLACQFHPELSGAWGVALLRRWLGAEG